MDALSEQGMIPAGTTVRVIQVLDNQVKVRSMERDEEITT
jgi:hypothetical protein